MAVSIAQNVPPQMSQTEDEFSPFERSLSCWCLAALYVVDLLAGIKHHRLAPADSLFHVVLLECVGLFTVIFLLRYRKAQTLLLRSNALDAAAAKQMQRMSASALGLAGFALISILFAFLQR